MSDESEAVDKAICANCGIAEIDDTALAECNSCDLVRYCSDECQNNHKSEHEEAFKKRAADLRDIIQASGEHASWGLSDLLFTLVNRSEQICHEAIAMLQQNHL